MENFNNVFQGSKGIHLILGQQGMKCPYELVHSCDHGLSVWETGIPFLVVIRIEDDVVFHTAVSHQVQILAQHCIPMFGDSQVLAGVSRLIDARIGARKGDELLVGGELGDVGNLGKEVGSGNLTDAGDGSEDFHLALVQGILELHQGLGEILVTLLACKHGLGAVTDHGGTIADTYGGLGEVLDVLYGYFLALAALLHIHGLLQLPVGGPKYVLGTPVDAQELQQGLGEDIEAQQLGKCDGQVALEDGLCLCKILGIGGPAPGEHLALAVKLHPVLLQCTQVGLRIPCDGDGIKSVGLGPSERLPVMKVLDEQWVNDTCFPAVVQEKVVERQVVAPGGFHDEQRGIAYLGGSNEGREAVVVEGERTLALYSLGSQNTECGRLAGDIQCDDGHKKTSCGLESGSRFPVSRLKEARWLNQPIGKFGTEDRLLLKFKDLIKMRSSVPELYHQKSVTYRKYRINYY